MKAVIENAVREAAPDYHFVLITANVKNGPTSDELVEAIRNYSESARKIMEIPDINQRPGIAATRAAYKALGKDPNRYRPSHEQLMRRILQGKGLYQVSALVDTGNLLSVMTGDSVGIFDVEKVQGELLSVGVGRDGEPYEGIGRGALNIANLPVVRDAAGGIGTPTSDNERTKVTEDTTRIVMTIHCFGNEMPIPEVIDLAEELLTKYCSASDFTAEVIS